MSGVELISSEEVLALYEETSTSLVRASPPFRITCSCKCCAGRVLYMVDTVDEHAVQQLNEFDSNKLNFTKRSCGPGGEDKKKVEETKAEF